VSFGYRARRAGESLSTVWPGSVMASRCGGLMVVLLIGLSGIGSFACGPPRPPNIVLIIGDDHGYPDFGFMGSDNVETPTLDALAAEGTLFENGYLTATICAPSLQSILNGLHPYAFKMRQIRLGAQGVERKPRQKMRDFQTLPRLLAAHGYATYQGGKIVEEDYQVAGFGDGMAKPGVAKSGWAGGETIGRKTMTPVFDFIDANTERPFFLWYAPLLPHIPHDPPQEFREPFEGRGFSRPAVAYYANILRFDRSVEQLLAHLEARGLSDDTVVVYLADNGWDQGPKVGMGSLALGGAKGKKSMYDLGFRTPIVLRWPGHIAAGAVQGELISSLDLFPTLLGYAGVPVPSGRLGVDLRPLLDGEQAWTREALYGAQTHVRANALRPESLGVPDLLHPEFSFFVRTGRWHYIFYEGWDAEQLFDILADPDEDVNLASEHPKLIARFRDELVTWKDGLRRDVASAPPDQPF